MPTHVPHGTLGAVGAGLCFVSMACTDIEIAPINDDEQHASESAVQNSGESGEDGGETSRGESAESQTTDADLQELSGDVVITGTDDLNQLQGIQVIRGSLTIEDSNLVDLSGLEALVEVTGILTIHGNRTLRSLRGLGQLRFVGSDREIATYRALRVQNNPKLERMDALGALSSAGAGIRIHNNAILANVALPRLTGTEVLELEDLPALTQLGRFPELAWQNTELTIEDCPALNDLAGLTGVETLAALRLIDSGQRALPELATLRRVTGNLVLDGLDFSTARPELPQLKRVGGLSLNDLVGTTMLPHFSALFEIDHYLEIDGNDELTELSGFPALSSVGYGGPGSTYDPQGVTISRSPKLKNLDAFDGAIDIATTLSIYDSGITIFTLPRAQHIDAIRLRRLPELQEIHIQSTNLADDATLVFEELPQLRSLSGLSSLEMLGGLHLQQIPLADLVGLEHLHHVGSLSLAAMPTLTNLDTLTDLRFLGSLSIKDCQQLAHIDGLAGVLHMPGKLHVERNPNLLSLAGLSGVADFDAQIEVCGNPKLQHLPQGSQVDSPWLYVIYNASLEQPAIASWLADGPHHPHYRVAQNGLEFGSPPLAICPWTEDSRCDEAFGCKGDVCGVCEQPPCCDTEWVTGLCAENSDPRDCPDPIGPSQ